MMKKVETQRFRYTIILLFIVSLLAVVPLSSEAFESHRCVKILVAGWSEDILLSNLTDGTWGEQPDIATYGEVVHVVYENPLLYRRSSDGGKSWTDEKRMTYIQPYTENPKIAVKENTIHLVYEVGLAEVYYKHSLDNGDSWGSDVLLSEDDGMMSYQPSIAVDGGCVHVVWKETKDFGGSPGFGEIYYKRSVDDGENWEDGLGDPNPRRLTDDDLNSAGPVIAVNGACVYVFWDQETSSGWRTPYYAYSENNGKYWSVGKNVTPLGSFDRWVDDVEIGGNHIYLVGREDKWVGGTPYYSIWFVESEDSGKNWSLPVKLVDQEVTGGGCGGPQIVADGSRLTVVWTDGRDAETSELYYKHSSDYGNHWGDDIRLTYSEGSSGFSAVALVDATLHVVWQDTRYNDTPEVFYKRSPGFSPEITYSHPETSNIIISETENITFNITAFDPDNQRLNYSWYVNNSLVATNTTNHTFYADYNSAGVYNITVMVSDPNYNTSHSWNLTVRNLNRLPNITYYSPMYDPIINETENLTFSINATDPDGQNLSYFWYINANLEAENQTSYIFYTNYTSSGIYNMTVIVFDSEDYASHSWGLTVLNKNRKPVIELIENQTACEGQLFTLQINGIDLDGDALIFSDNSTLFDINSTTGLISFIPSYDSAGAYFINITVTDGEDVVWRTFKLEIINVNRAPVAVITSPDQNVKFSTNDNIPFDAAGSYDPDNDSLTYTWTSNIDGSIGNTASFSRKLSKGTHTITLIVDDGNGGTDTKQIIITVKKPSEPSGGFIPGFETNLLLFVCLLAVIIILLRRRNI